MTKKKLEYLHNLKAARVEQHRGIDSTWVLGNKHWAWTPDSDETIKHKEHQAKSAQSIDKITFE